MHPEVSGYHYQGAEVSLVGSVVRYSNFYILSQLEKSVRMRALAFGNSNCLFCQAGVGVDPLS